MHANNLYYYLDISKYIKLNLFHLFVTIHFVSLLYSTEGDTDVDKAGGGAGAHRVRLAHCTLGARA